MPSASAPRLAAASPTRLPPIIRSGAISASGTSTKARLKSSGWGKRQPIGRQRDVVIVDDVDVDHARAPALGGNPAEFDLEPLDPDEQRLGGRLVSATAQALTNGS